jgi:hypothetical protein
MRASQLRGGQIDDITVRPHGEADFGVDLEESREVMLRPGAGHSSLLQAGTSVWPVEGVSRDDQLELASLAPLGRARITYVLAVTRKREQAVLRSHRFVEAAELPDEHIPVGIDEKIIEQIERRTGDRHTLSSACAWVSDQFVLLPSPASALPRMVVAAGSGEATSLRAFRILGAGDALEVQTGGGGFVAARLVAGGAGGDPLSARLLSGRFSVAHLDQLQVTTGGDGDAIGAILAGGTYFSLWSRYNALELRNLYELARQLGVPRYARATLQRDGSWRFDLIGAAANEFLDRLRTLQEREREQEVEATEDDPTYEWLDADGTDGSDLSRMSTITTVLNRSRAFKGSVELVDKSRACVYLRPIRDQGDDPPPQRGYLALATAGTRVVNRRRRTALERLAFGTCPLPELASLLELKRVPPRRKNAGKSWKSRAVEAAFGGDPTPAQQRAVEAALNTPDIAVIQGPPGTGKTRVIAAIAARLAEEAGPRDHSRLVLLSSFQHDAVDNVAARTTVFGLPTVKEGARQDSQESWMTGWRLERLAEARELLGARHDADLARLQHWVEDQHEAYVSAPVPLQGTAELLRNVAARCDDVLPPDLAEALLDYASDLDRRVLQDRNQSRYGDLVAAIRAIRVDPVAFADDGRTTAARAIRRLRRHPELQADTEILELAAGWNRGAPLDFLPALDSCRGALLDRVAIERLHTASPLRDHRATELLTKAVQEVGARAATGGVGLAGVIAGLVDDLASDPEAVHRSLATYASVIAATCQGAGSIAPDPRYLKETDTFDTVIIDEAARANPLDLVIPMTLARRRVVLVGDQRQLPHIVDTEIERELAGTEDEAKAVQESLFSRLYDFLRHLDPKDNVTRVVTLNRQFRMHPVLGAFVSATFYEPHGDPIESPRGPDEFDHGLADYLGIVAAWHDISDTGAGGREERNAGHSVRRPAEARWVAREVKALMEAAEHLSFGVIAFYTAQRDAILEELEALGVASRDARDKLGILEEPWRTGLDANNKAFERLRVGTVDAFQGKEFDVCILSAVRSPRAATGDARKVFGHLAVENRLCVAMSRQKRLLIVAGDRRLLEHPLAPQAIPGLVAFGELCGGRHGAFH